MGWFSKASTTGTISQITNTLIPMTIMVDGEMLKQATFGKLDESSSQRLQVELSLLSMACILMTARQSVNPGKMNDALQQNLYDGYAAFLGGERGAEIHPILFSRTAQYAPLLHGGFSKAKPFSDCMLELMPLVSMNAGVDVVMGSNIILMGAVATALKEVFVETIRACKGLS